MEKIHNMQEQTGTISRKMEISKKPPKGNVGNKKYCKRNKECLFGFISTPDLNKQRISDLEDMSKELQSLKCQGKKESEKQSPKKCGTITT